MIQTIIVDGPLRRGQITVSTLDVLPTLVAAAHVELPATKQLDGVDLLPYVTREKAGTPHEVLYWKLQDFAAVRQGKWKLFIDNSKGIASLHDLDADPGEKIDLTSKEPAKFAELKQLYATWNSKLPPRGWTN